MIASSGTEPGHDEVLGYETRCGIDSYPIFMASPPRSSDMLVLRTRAPPSSWLAGWILKIISLTSYLHSNYSAEAASCPALPSSSS